MYSLSVGCLFRNESHSIVEWLEHYLFHGVEHFYLINDASDDGFQRLLDPYLKNGVVTLFNANWDRYVGRQRDMYNCYVLPRLSETKWLLMVDMDEYVWSPVSVNLNDVLAQCDKIGQIQIEHTLFGSAGHVDQPRRIVESFTRRSDGIVTKVPGNRKYFINSSFKFISLNVHHATFVYKTDEKSNFFLLNETYFRMNHYSCQSLEFWETVKCTRGDGDNWRKRTKEDFDTLDLNDVEDEGLLQQNLPIIDKMRYL